MRTLILATVLVLLVHTEAMSDKFNDYRGGGGGFIGEGIAATSAKIITS